MKFPNITDLIRAVCEHLSGLTDASGCPLFVEVRGAVLSGNANLFGLLPELTLFPVAVVSVGAMVPEHTAAARTLEIQVTVIDEFRVSAGDLGTYELVDLTGSSLSGSLPGEALRLGGGHLVLERIEPLNLDGSHTAWCIKINAKTSLIL